MLSASSATGCSALFVSIVDSITISGKDGALIVSSEGNGSSEALTGTALMNYVASEMPGSESIMVKASDGWKMLMPFGDKVYIIKAASEMNQVEFRALSKEVEDHLKSL